MLFLTIVFVFIYSHNCLSQSLILNQSLPFVEATLATESVRTDPDDPAIWIHPIQPELSLIIATDKRALTGGLYVFDPDGKILQHIDNMDRPNNVDVEYRFQINETYSIDLVVLTEREKKRLRIFSIDISKRQLNEIIGGNTYVFTDNIGKQAAPMGIGLYKRLTDGKIYAIVSRKSGPKHGYLAQYELIWNGQSIDLKLIRYFGDFNGIEIESIVIDDQLGYVYYSDENSGIRKYNVDPTTNQTEQLGFIDTSNYQQGDSEGLALYTTSDKNGYLIVTEQIRNESIFHIYERQGNNSYINSIKTYADKTDGIEATNQWLNKNFPNGLLIVMNERDRNFLLYDWRNIEKELGVRKNCFYYYRGDLNYFLLESFILFYFRVYF